MTQHYENFHDYRADCMAGIYHFEDDLGPEESQKWLFDIVTEMHAQDSRTEAFQKGIGMSDAMIAAAWQKHIIPA